MEFSVMQARKYAGLTQAETAEKMGVCRDTYRRIEKNPEKATIEQAYRFSEVVGLALDQIFFRKTST